LESIASETDFTSAFKRSERVCTVGIGVAIIGIRSALVDVGAAVAIAREAIVTRAEESWRCIRTARVRVARMLASLTLVDIGAVLSVALEAVFAAAFVAAIEI